MPMQEVPGFIGRSAEIWARTYLRADLVPHRARPVPARRGARLRQAPPAALILRSARNASAAAKRNEVRESRRMGAGGAASCFETHRSARGAWKPYRPAGAAMLLSMRPREKAMSAMTTKAFAVC